MGEVKEYTFEELCQKVGAIAAEYGILKVYLFGSRARGDKHARLVSESLKKRSVRPVCLQFDEMLYTLNKDDLRRGPFQRGRRLDLNLVLLRRKVSSRHRRRR